MNRWVHATHRTTETVIQIESWRWKWRYMNVIRTAQQTALNVITVIIIAVIGCRIVITIMISGAVIVVVIVVAAIC